MNQWAVYKRRVKIPRALAVYPDSKFFEWGACGEFILWIYLSRLLLADRARRWFKDGVFVLVYFKLLSIQTTYFTGASD